MTDTQIEKTVDMVFYDAEQAFGSNREWASQLVEADLTEKEKQEFEYVKVEVNLGGATKELKFRTHNFTEEGLSAGQNLADGDILSVNHVTETEYVHQKRALPFLNTFILEVCEVVPDAFTAGGVGLELDPSFSKRRHWVGDPDADQITHELKIGRARMEKRRVLAKESERESDDLYETMAEVPSVKFEIKMKSDSRDVIDAMTEAFIPEIHREFASIEAIGKVRYMACEIQETQQGECYNI